MVEFPSELSTYRVDASDTITAVNASWLTFAARNGAPDLNERAVLGRSLWSFVSGDEIRELYRAVFERARSLDISILIPFRCDSPGLRRYMRMIVSHVADGALRLDAVPIREESQRHLALLDLSAVRSESTLSMCGQCKRILAPGGDWLEPEDAAVRLRLLASNAVPRLTHSVCPRCGDLFRESLGGGVVA